MYINKFIKILKFLSLLFCKFIILPNNFINILFSIFIFKMFLASFNHPVNNNICLYVEL